MKPFKIRKAKDGQFYFVQVAKNGKVLTTSETYKEKRSAVKGAIACINSTYFFFSPNSDKSPFTILHYSSAIEIED